MPSTPAYQVPTTTNNGAPEPDGEPLVSRTDPGGRIVFANDVFVEVSGFTDVRGTNHDGIHVRFGAMEPWFEQALSMLLEPPHEARPA
jgi:hypothetical protein